MPVRVGVVGLGFMGKTHLGIHAKNKHACITAVCDYDPRRASGDLGKTGGNLGSGSDLNLDPKKVKKYHKPEELFADPNVDLVDICLPTYVHAEYVIKALTAGKHVLCEKPMALDLRMPSGLSRRPRNQKAT
jgi:predicted dehydrogenase